MKYTVKEFRIQFPDDKACLDFIFQSRYGDLKYCPKCAAETKFYPTKIAKVYVCKHCRYQISPLANTIFHKSSTSLWNWFYAIYLFSVAKNGVSAKELERHLGVTYKTAWRIAKQIRLLMQQDTEMLSGIIEADETYVGGRQNYKDWYRKKTPVVGVVEKKGRLKAQVVSGANATTIIPYLKANIKPLSFIHTDESRIYKRVKRDFQHSFVTHSKKEFSRKGVHTNTIEGFWSQFKRSVNGTYHSISPKYMQSYVNEFVFRYNYRQLSVFQALLLLAVKPI